MIKIPQIENYKKAFITFLKELTEKNDCDEEIVENIKFDVERTFKITISSKTSCLDLLRKLILGFITYANLTKVDRDDIGLAVDEACTNIIKHSYGEQQEGKIDVDITLSSKHVIISITDTGEKGQKFNPNDLPNFEKKRYLEQLERGGLGVYIIKTIMDEVEYNIQPGAYNKLIMVKHIKPKLSDS